MTSVLVIDDHPIVLQGCRRVLETAGIRDVLEARDAASGYKLFRRHRPNVVVVDMAMGGSSLAGLAVINRIKSSDPGARIVVLSMHSDPVTVSRALEAGAAGYILKDTAVQELVDAVEAVQAGNAYMSHDLAARLALTRTRARQSPLGKLTPRELQTLTLLAEGKPYSGIAEELKVSYKTVVNTSAQLKQKLKANALPALVRAAVQLLAAAQ
jgi:two-component system, NarL family, invasion response regulator UvrY